MFDLSTVGNLVSAVLIFEPVFTQKETLRRRLRNVSYGWRLSAACSWLVDHGSADEVVMVNAGFYLNRSATRIELTMNGATYRDAVLSSWARTNLEGKNVKAQYSMELACVDLLSEDSLPPEVSQSPPIISSWRGWP